MDSPYRTLGQLGCTELVVKKSRFIGQAMPAASAEAALAWIAERKKECWNATHNVWAYTLRDGQRRYSDDGEPQGTAGLPTLEILQKEALLDCTVVITRYFGGTLLGASGLARAYAQAAKAAVDAAGVVTMTPCAVLSARCDYGVYGKLQQLLPAFGCTVLRAEFGESVIVELQLPSETAPAFRTAVTDASGGRADVKLAGETFAAM